MDRSSLPATMTRAVVLLGVLAASATAQDTRLEEARTHYQNLQDEQALQLANEFLLDHPASEPAAVLRAQCLAELGRWPEARKTLERVRTPGFETRLLLAEAMAGAGDAVAAFELFDQLALEDSVHYGPRVKRAKALLKTGQYQRAQAEIEVVLRANSRNAEAALVLGMIFEGTRQVGAALQTYMRLAQQQAEFDAFDRHIEKAAVEGIARVSMTNGMYDQAVDFYGMLSQHFPEKAAYWFGLGMAQGMRNKFEEAIANVKKAVELEPENVLYRIRLAEVFYSQKRLPEAIAEFEYLATVLEDPRLPSLRLAEMYLEQGDLQKANGNLQVVLGLVTESADVQSVAGKVQEKLGDLQAAKGHFRRAVELDPLNFGSLFRLASLLQRSDDEAENEEGRGMMERYQRVVEYLPDIELARAELAISPNNPELFIRMGAILNAAQEYELAIPWMDKAQRTAPNNPRVWVWSGQIAANFDENEAALQFFRRALQLMGETPEAAIVEHVRRLEAGEPLDLPLGRLIRPTREETPRAPGSGDGS